MPDITHLLGRWKLGERGVDNELAEAIYPTLREIAGQHLRGRAPGSTLRATELAHEAYLRLERQRAVDWQNRDHFYAIAATVVRRVLVDHLRERGAEKRGGGLLQMPYDEFELQPDDAAREPVAWLAVDEALTELERIEPDCARVVELRVFGGLTTESIAEVCGSSTATVGRQWRFARVWLADRLESPA
jgi:RNA polymerase sigma factor (TIGR02999 family)